MSFFLSIWRFALGHAWLCAFNETQGDSISTGITIFDRISLQNVNYLVMNKVTALKRLMNKDIIFPWIHELFVTDQRPIFVCFHGKEILAAHNVRTFGALRHD